MGPTRFFIPHTIPLPIGHGKPQPPPTPPSRPIKFYTLLYFRRCVRSALVMYSLLAVLLWGRASTVREKDLGPQGSATPGLYFSYWCGPWQCWHLRSWWHGHLTTNTSVPEPGWWAWVHGAVFRVLIIFLHLSYSSLWCFSNQADFNFHLTPVPLPQLVLTLERKRVLVIDPHKPNTFHLFMHVIPSADVLIPSF